MTKSSASSGRIVAIATLVAMLGVTPSQAVEVTDLKGFEALFGRYAPAGDCGRQPQIVVDVSGMTFEVAGKSEKVTNPEYAASYGPADYSGSSQWFFPFRIPNGYPILMTFNYDEMPGVLAIEAQDEGYPGGPKLTPRDQALVGGSPYQRCK
jgi:hypothetical protein